MDNKTFKDSDWNKAALEVAKRDLAIANAKIDGLRKRMEFGNDLIATMAATIMAALIVADPKGSEYPGYDELATAAKKMTDELIIALGK